MKHKKLIIILLILITIFILLTLFLRYKMNTENNEEYFIKISNEKQGYIVYDKRTRVQYFISNKGYICQLVDYTGNPLLYKY